MEGFEPTIDSLHTLHFGRHEFLHLYDGATPQTDDLRTMLYTLPSVFTRVRSVLVNDGIAVPGIAGAKEVFSIWLLHWQKLMFKKIVIGILYVNIDFAIEANLDTLRAHVGDVLSKEHAYNVHLEHYYERGQRAVYYYYNNTSTHVSGRLAVVYAKQLEEGEHATSDDALSSGIDDDDDDDEWEQQEEEDTEDNEHECSDDEDLEHQEEEDTEEHPVEQEQGAESGITEHNSKHVGLVVLLCFVFSHCFAGGFVSHCGCLKMCCLFYSCTNAYYVSACFLCCQQNYVVIDACLCVRFIE